MIEKDLVSFHITNFRDSIFGDKYRFSFICYWLFATGILQESRFVLIYFLKFEVSTSLTREISIRLDAF